MHIALYISLGFWKTTNKRPNERRPNLGRQQLLLQTGVITSRAAPTAPSPLPLSLSPHLSHPPSAPPSTSLSTCPHVCLLNLWVLVRVSIGVHVWLWVSGCVCVSAGKRWFVLFFRGQWSCSLGSIRWLQTDPPRPLHSHSGPQLRKTRDLIGWKHFGDYGSKTNLIFGGFCFYFISSSYQRKNMFLYALNKSWHNILDQLMR